jgi:hypothetical protein
VAQGIVTIAPKRSLCPLASKKKSYRHFTRNLQPNLNRRESSTNNVIAGETKSVTVSPDVEYIPAVPFVNQNSEILSLTIPARGLSQQMAGVRRWA